MCRTLGVSRSGYYDWRRRGLSERAVANTALLDRIREIYTRSRENYGARKIWRALIAAGARCGRHRVERLCSAHGIAAKRMRRFRSVYASRTAVFDYIEVFYNRQRLHQTLDYLTPVRYEERAVA